MVAGLGDQDMRYLRIVALRCVEWLRLHSPHEFGAIEIFKNPENSGKLLIGQSVGKSVA
jgi:hypothetical protein